MSNSKTPPRSSLPAVAAFREKLESIAENQLEDLKKLNARLDKFTPVPPPAEGEDPNPTPQVAVQEAFEAEPDPFPSAPPAHEEKK